MRALKPILLTLFLAFGCEARTYRVHDGGMQRSLVAEEQPVAAAAVTGTPAAEPQIILYEAGAEKNEYSKRIATRQVLLKAASRAEAERVAKKHGAKVAAAPDYAPGFYILETPTCQGALDLAGTLQATPLLARQQQKRAIPNDPLFPNQWHLLNAGQNGGTAGRDINVASVWETYQGSTVLIGIVDDGLLTTHADLSANVDTDLDWDFNGNDADPSPETGDTHGTPCAGVAAARGNNGIGGSGAAPCATLVGLRLIAAATTDQQEANALNINNALIQIKSNSWGPADDGTTIEGPGALAAAALKSGAETGRGGKGTLFFWAGGNGLEAGDDANYDGYANSIYTLAIGAVDLNGEETWYGEPGACLMVCAPSSGDSVGITTTASDGGYENDFGGTSSATPLAAGVAALMLDANPNLGWRDVQEILMRSARKNDASDSDWIDNAAGFHFNHKYGAGMVDAEAAITLGETWTNLGAHTSTTLSLAGLNQPIPDDYGGVASQTFGVAENFRVEHVTLTTGITHEYRSDVEIELVSPSGTTSLLAHRYDDPNEDINWTFSTVRNWGENAAGNWTVNVYDNYASDTGTVNSLTLTLYGTHDADGDLMDDSWEMENFGATTIANATTDYDRDGFADYAEWRAGTQPTNSASRLSIDAVQAGSGRWLRWQSVAGKSYTVQYSTNLSRGFQTLETHLIATPPQNVFTNLSAGPYGFYRILLEAD